MTTDFYNKVSKRIELYVKYFIERCWRAIQVGKLCVLEDTYAAGPVFRLDELGL